MQLDLSALFDAPRLAPVRRIPRPAPAPVVAPEPMSTTVLPERFSITASSSGVTITSPAQVVAAFPFQPIAERTSLPAMSVTYRWPELRPLFARYEACEDVDHPAGPWLERIAAAVAKTEGLALDIRPWCTSWTRVTCRSLWTGLDVPDLLRRPESTGCDTREQAIARADAIAARLRAAGRFVVIRDKIAAVEDEDGAELPLAAADEPRLRIAPGTLRLGALVITVGAGASAP
jgi:hypothetical protein